MLFFYNLFDKLFLLSIISIMTKLSKFLQSNNILVKWTIGYVLFWGIILRFIFDFNIFSKTHWVRFFTETMHGFWGLVFVTAIYGSVLIYIASAMLIYRKNKPILEITVPEKVKTITSNISKIFSYSKTETTTEKTTTNTTQQSSDEEYPNGLPAELYVPYMRAKNHITKTEAVSDFNKQPDEKPVPTPESQQKQPQTESFPIPTDFDISESLPENTPIQNDNSIPIFKDLDFDTPIEQTKPDTTQNNTKNTVIKYCEQNGLEYEILDDFVMMKKYLIYTHDDEGFWIMDDDNWFASGKQKKSPVNKLIDLSEQYTVSPVIYFETKNILDIEHVISGFERKGIRVIMDLSELP